MQTSEAEFRDRKKDHDGIARAMVTRIAQQLGWNVEPFGVESLPEIEKDDILSSPWYATIHQRSRPDLYVARNGKVRLLEIKTEQGRHPNFAVAIESYWHCKDYSIATPCYFLGLDTSTGIWYVESMPALRVIPQIMIPENAPDREAKRRYWLERFPHFTPKDCKPIKGSDALFVKAPKAWIKPWTLAKFLGV